MSIENGGPAFPVADYDHQTFQPDNLEEARRLLSGMTLRDYFAAKAMQGWSANPIPQDSSIQEVAAWAYRQADAMLAARNEPR